MTLLKSHHHNDMHCHVFIGLWSYHYWSTVWCPYTMIFASKLEQDQRMAKRMIPKEQRGDILTWKGFLHLTGWTSNPNGKTKLFCLLLNVYLDSLTVIVLGRTHYSVPTTWIQFYSDIIMPELSAFKIRLFMPSHGYGVLIPITLQTFWSTLMFLTIDCMPTSRILDYFLQMSHF